MPKAIGLMSGGLDSILAVKLILEQGIEVIGVCFTSPFFNNTLQVKQIAEQLYIRLEIIAFDDDYIKMIQKPKYGYGKAFNPCIDCHTYMLKKAKELMEKLKVDFVFTGEVLGERPMSQNIQALKNIEREAGLIGKLLRPLSAQLLEPTIAENTGIIDRTKLSNISGRSRKPQLTLAKKYGITDVPQPAGGCLLTDKGFSQRLKDAFEHNESSLNDLELLKFGRHFRIADTDSVKIIAGRNKKENEQIEKLAQKTDIIIKPEETVGPVVLIRNYKDSQKSLRVAAGLCARYSDKKDLRLVKIKVNDIIIETEPLEESLISKLRI
jgi:tRNA U34 2-thiouridine synthase MnmA/TrmU